MADPLALGALAQALLETVTATLVDAGRPVGRSFLSHGAPAWDACPGDQVTVHLAPLSFRSTGAGRQQQTQPLAGLVVQLVRCVPVPDDTGAAPSALELDESALGLMTDAARVFYAVAVTSSWAASCDSVTFGQMNPLGPLGGRAGWTWQVTATL